MIQVRGERISSENRLEIERESDQREKELKRRGAVEKKAKWGLIGRRIGRTQRGKDDSEQEKDKVEWRISNKDQREEGIQRAPEKILKRGQQQRKSELRL